MFSLPCFLLDLDEMQTKACSNLAVGRIRRQTMPVEKFATQCKMVLSTDA